MKLSNQNSSWYYPAYDRAVNFYDVHVPMCLKIPRIGKFVVYNREADNWKLDPKSPWSPSSTEIEEVKFEQGIHLISGLELSHPKPKNRIDNIINIKVLFNDSYSLISKENMSLWFYISASEKLKRYSITSTGCAHMYPASTHKNLIQLAGGEYTPKPTKDTNLVLNFSAVPTKTLVYAKKHNIKKINEAEFFKLFV